MQQAVRDAELGRRYADKLIKVATREGDEAWGLVVMAQLKALLETEDGRRKDAKLQPIRLLYHRGYGEQQILELFRVIDWMRQLPPEAETLFQQDQAELEAETKMPYITSIERSGIKKGIAQGEFRGEKKSLHSLLNAKFGDAYTNARRQQAEQADSYTLKAWSLRRLTANTIQGVFQDPA